MGELYGPSGPPPASDPGLEPAHSPKSSRGQGCSREPELVAPSPIPGGIDARTPPVTVDLSSEPMGFVTPPTEDSSRPQQGHTQEHTHVLHYPLNGVDLDFSRYSHHNLGLRDILASRLVDWWFYGGRRPTQKSILDSGAKSKQSSANSREKSKSVEHLVALDRLIESPFNIERVLLPPSQLESLLLASRTPLPDNPNDHTQNIKKNIQALIQYYYFLISHPAMADFLRQNIVLDWTPDPDLVSRVRANMGSLPMYIAPREPTPLPARKLAKNPGKKMVSPQQQSLFLFSEGDIVRRSPGYWDRSQIHLGRARIPGDSLLGMVSMPDEFVQRNICWYLDRSRKASAYLRSRSAPYDRQYTAILHPKDNEQDGYPIRLSEPRGCMFEVCGPLGYKAVLEPLPMLLFFRRPPISEILRRTQHRSLSRRHIQDMFHAPGEPTVRPRPPTDIPLPPYSDAHANTTCQNCLEKGHRTRDCIICGFCGGEDHIAPTCTAPVSERCKCAPFPTYHLAKRCPVPCSRRCGNPHPPGFYKHRNAMTCRYRCCMCGIHGHTGRDCKLKKCRCGARHLGQDCGWKPQCRVNGCPNYLCGKHCRECGSTEKPFVGWRCGKCLANGKPVGPRAKDIG